MLNIKSKNAIAILLIAALIICISFLYFNKNSANADEDTASQKINKLNQLLYNLEKYIEKKPLLATSSNPFDYANNEYFDKITKLGIEYLPFVIEKIEVDESLASYLMAIAASKISRASISIEYSHSHEWLEGWKKYVATVPAKYEKLKLNQDVNDQSLFIEELGAPVVPYIIKDIKNGDIRFSNVLRKLIEPKKLPKGNSVDSWEKWADENQTQYK